MPESNGIVRISTLKASLPLIIIVVSVGMAWGTMYAKISNIETTLQEVKLRTSMSNDKLGATIDNIKEDIAEIRMEQAKLKMCLDNLEEHENSVP